MKKRLTALFLVLTLVLTLFGCAAETKEKDAVDEYFEQKKEDTTEFIAFDKEKEDISKDPLRILMDLEYVGREPRDASTVLNEFLNTLEQSGGLTDVVIEYVPKHGADRENMLDRVRVELMTGGGPDVFIVNCAGYTWFSLEDSLPLFPFPEKAMENGIFLPLDTYMKNNAQYAEWDKQTQTVLAAGRNEEGQQIIPLTYTLPLLCYSTDDVPEFSAAKDASWTDIVNDPALSELARPLYDCFSIHHYEGEPVYEVPIGQAEYILGDFADYADEELLFTEEEVFQRAKELFALCDRTKDAAPDGFERYRYGLPHLGWALAENTSAIIKEPAAEDGSVELFYGTEPLTLIPIYSDDGGITASIMSFAAVNRNTQRPEEAYIVIDLLMRDFVQRKYSLYSELLTGIGVGVSMHEDLMLKETSVGGNREWWMSPQRYEQVCEIRDRITTANFQTELDAEVYEMFVDCLMVYFNNGSDEEVKSAISERFERMRRLVKE